MPEKKITQIFNTVYSATGDYNKAVFLALIGAIVQDQWLISNDNTIIALRREAADPFSFINKQTKTIIIPSDYQESIAHGLQQECVLICTQRRTFHFFRALYPVVYTGYKVRPGNFNALQQEIKNTLKTETSPMFSCEFEDNFKPMKDFPSHIPSSFTKFHKQKDIPQQRHFSTLWDYWYG